MFLIEIKVKRTPFFRILENFYKKKILKQKRYSDMYSTWFYAQIREN